jgi:CheY-like chemotaxis protein
MVILRITFCFRHLAHYETVAVMAHDIRTPLHQVVGSIKLLAASGMNAEQTESVDMLQTSAHGLLAIINDLLDFTNLEAGKMKIETIPFDVRGVLEGSVASLRSQVHDKGLDVSCQIDQGVPIRLMGDPNRLRQVVLNMLSNAVKFTSHGRVNIESKTMPQEDGSIRIRFTVADTGIGIAKDEYERIFNPYEQAEVSVSRIYGGTGLGLAICKSLVENMGGEIGVTSVVGEGTTFWFEMPFGLYATPHVPEEKKVDSDSDPSDEISGLEVLVAEDNKMNQKVVVRMLQRLGHHATVVENGQECVAEISNSPKKYNIILMDWQMPVMDGIDATKELRSKGYNMSDLPIVGLTASVDYLDFFELGMNDCLKKPVRILDLKAALIKNV